MILYELFEDEQHPAYRELSAANLQRQYDFLKSIVAAALAANRPMVSTAIITALNYHAISCLHVNASEYELHPSVHQRERAHRTGTLLLRDLREGRRFTPRRRHTARVDSAEPR